MPSTTSLPRRSTRSSLARFAYSDDSKPARDASSSLSPDIEDAIPDSSAAARKRKRTTTTTTTVAPSGSTTVRTKVKMEELAPPAKAPAPRKVRKPARTVRDPDTGETSIEAPSNWEEMYQLVKAMRLPPGPASGAAVDTMGCERLADAASSAVDRRFHTLVALMLSSQTKDTVNFAAMERLRRELPACAPGKPPGLNLDNMLAVDPELLNQLIWQVGFHNNKTKYIKQAAILLRDKWGGDIPPTIEGLTSLPGVGPKMAYLCMSAENGWNRVEGIGVDVHVHRITNLWGWNKTNTPEETRHALQAWLPHEKWKEINWLLVGFGQKVCLPIGRRCGDCELGLRGLCRAAERKKVVEGRRAREERAKTETDGTVIKTEDTVEESVVKEHVVNEDVPREDEKEALDEPSSSKRRGRRPARQG